MPLGYEWHHLSHVNGTSSIINKWASGRVQNYARARTGLPGSTAWYAGLDLLVGHAYLQHAWGRHMYAQSITESTSIVQY